MAVLVFEDCELDSDTGELTRAGQTRRIGRQCLDLLLLLHENRDRVVTKDEIVDRLWNNDAISDAALSTAIKEARAAVGDDGKSQRIIRTIHRRGFQFVGRAPEKAGRSARDPVLQEFKSATDTRPSVAVLAFANLSGLPDQAYFAEGITQDILTELSRFWELRVTAPGSSIHVADGTLLAADAAKRLDVDFLVMGAVRRSEHNIRVSAQLVDARSGTHFWAERYDRPLDDVFAIQDDIAQSVARGIFGKLDQTIVKRAQSTPAHDMTAYDCFLKARWGWWHGMADAEVVALLDEATERDPGFARAYALKGMVHEYSLFERGIPSRESAETFLDYMSKAVSLDNRDAGIQALAALANLYSGNHAAALNHSKLAMDLNPNSIEAIHYRAIVLGACGSPQEAMKLHREAIELDPFHPDGYYEPMLEAYYLMRQYDEAIAIYETWREPPAHLHLEAAACYAQMGNTNKVHAALAAFAARRSAEFNFDMYLDGLLKLHARQADRDHWIDGLRKAGLIEA